MTAKPRQATISPKEICMAKIRFPKQCGPRATPTSLKPSVISPPKWTLYIRMNRRTKWLTSTTASDTCCVLLSCCVSSSSFLWEENRPLFHKSFPPFPPIDSLKMFIENFKVESPNVQYADGEIHSVYSYETTELVHENRNGTYQWIVKPKTVKYEFKTDIHVPKLGFVPFFYPI